MSKVRRPLQLVLSFLSEAGTTAATRYGCLGLSAGSFLLQLAGGYTSHSLLLCGTSLLQLAFTILLFPSVPRLRRSLPNEFRPAIPLLTSFLIWLLTLYIFFEAYHRTSDPAPLFAPAATRIALAGAAGNLLILAVLRTNGRPLALRSYLLPASYWLPVFLPLATGAVLAFLTLTGWRWLDAPIGCLLALPIFLVSGFRTLDAYWRILGVGIPKKTMQKPVNKKFTYSRLSSDEPLFTNN